MILEYGLKPIKETINFVLASEVLAAISKFPLASVIVYATMLLSFNLSR